MNWHTRYTQQAGWTRELRSYIFEKINLQNARNVLEVGCGTGAILSGLPQRTGIHGLDIDPVALLECGTHAPWAMRVQGSALELPYADGIFDILYSHYLLLWVRDPLQTLREMKRVTKRGGYVIAFAEPDYYHRIDKPKELTPLGQWQTEALRKQGADPGLGARLATLFFQADIQIIEAGEIQVQRNEPSVEDWAIEWDVIQSDLHGQIPAQEIQQMKELDKDSREKGERFLYVPTYFAWGEV